MEVIRVRLMKVGSFIPKFLLVMILWYPMIYALLFLRFAKFILKYEQAIDRFFDYAKRI